MQISFKVSVSALKPYLLLGGSHVMCHLQKSLPPFLSYFVYLEFLMNCKNMICGKEGKGFPSYFILLS